MLVFVKALLKTAIKYAGKYILQNYILKDIPIFGLIGSFKNLTKWKDFVKNISKSQKVFNTFKSLVKKNLLKQLHGVNFIMDLKKFGLKETAGRVIKNRLVPMEFRKFCYFLDILKREVKLEEAQQLLLGRGEQNKGKPLLRGNQIIITNDNVEKQVNFIDGIKQLKPTTKKEKEVLEDFKSKRLTFNVSSPRTHNFSQRLHFYDQKTQDYFVPIRSGGRNPYVKYYWYAGVPWKTVKEGMLKRDFGVRVFSKFRTK